MYVCVDAGHQGGVCVYSSYYSDSATGTSAMFGWAALEKFDCSAGVGRQQDIPS